MKTVASFLAGLFCLALVATDAHAQTAGDYRSAASGNWNSTASWEQFDGSGWTPASSTPTSSDGAITVRSPHTITVTASVSADQVSLESGAQIIVSAGITLTIANGSGTDLSVQGTFRSSGTVTRASGATIEFAAGSKYQHDFSTTAGTIPTASWNISSTCEVIGYTTNSSSPGGLSQSFGNFTWNCPGQTGNISAAGNLTTITGDFTVASTGSGQLRLAGSTSPTINVTGNYVQTGGTLVLTTSTGQPNLTVSGNCSISGGTLDMSSGTTGIGTLTVSGSFSHTGGTITESGSGSGSIVFNGGTQVYTSGGVVSNTINFTVNAGSTLDLGTSIVTGGGSFTLSSGATLNIGSADGITSATAAGNIQVSGVRTFSAGAAYVYDGSAAQVTGDGLPASVSSLTVENSGGVTLTASTTIVTQLALNSGDLTTGSNTLTMDSGATATGSPSPGSDVVGNVKRAHAFSSETSYSFGNQFVAISFASGGTSPSEVTVNLAKSSPTDFGNAVRRTYTITATGGSGFSATLRLHYLDSELNGNSETSLDLWKKASSTWDNQSRTANSTTDNWVELTGVTGFSAWTLAALAPTEITLLTARARAYDKGALLEWETGHELDNLGFNVYREEAGIVAQVNPSMIVGSALLFGAGVSVTPGRSYTWWDQEAKGKSDMRYWIEDVDLNGQRTMHGPIVPITVAGEPPAKSQAPLLDDLKATQRGFEHSSARLGASEGPAPMSFEPFPEKNATEKKAELADKPAVKITIKRDGWYRVGQPDLLAAGLDSKADPDRLQLYVGGSEVPIFVAGAEDGRFDPTDFIEFYGTGQDVPFTDSHTYWLISGQGPGRRIPIIAAPGQQGGAASFFQSVYRKDRVVFFASLRNGETENFFGPAVANRPIDQGLTLSSLDPAAVTEALVEVALQGVTNLPGSSPDHTVSVSLNGVRIGAVVFDGQARKVETFAVPQSLLLEGANTISLMSEGGPNDVSLIDYLRVGYWRTYNAEADLLRASVDPAAQSVQTISGFSNSSIRVIDITDPLAPQEMVGSIEQQEGEYSVSARIGQKTRVLLAFTSDRTLEPAAMTANRPSNWRKHRPGADVVMIAHGDFIAELAPLIELRSQQGLRVVVVDVEDLYDEFSYGEKTPQAIKDFLAHAAASWPSPPKFVLLVGDATYDPRDYFRFGNFDFVPTKQVDTARFETASDDWFADFNRDGLTEVAVGRLPVRTPAEASAVVAKIVGYERPPRQSGADRSVLMVADRNDGFDFEGAVRAAGGIVPAGVAVEEVFRGRTDDQIARRQVIEALDRGPIIVDYAGHGSQVLWRGNLLNASDAKALTNGQSLSFVITMTCLNGLFHDVAIEGLGEALLKAVRGGAIAVWASSGLTAPASQSPMNQEVFRQIFQARERGEKPITLGEVTSAAKAAVADGDVRRTWILLGDPATRLR